MDAVFADKILSILVNSYPAIGSKDLAEKAGTDENAVIQCLYEVKKIENGLFTISSGIGENIKDYQPMVPSIKSRLDDGGFSRLIKDAPMPNPTLMKEFLDSETKDDTLKLKVWLYLVFGIVVVFGILFWWYSRK